MLIVSGPRPSGNSDNQNNLAYWRGELGDAAGAAAAFETLLADRRGVLGPDHPDTRATRDNLACWRQQIRRRR